MRWKEGHFTDWVGCEVRNRAELQLLMGFGRWPRNDLLTLSTTSLQLCVTNIQLRMRIKDNNKRNCQTTEWQKPLAWKLVKFITLWGQNCGRREPLGSTLLLSEWYVSFGTVTFWRCASACKAAPSLTPMRRRMRTFWPLQTLIGIDPIFNLMY